MQFDGATAMANMTPPQKSGPSPWAVGLLVLSSAFAAVAITLMSLGV